MATDGTTQLVSVVPSVVPGRTHRTARRSPSCLRRGPLLEATRIAVRRRRTSAARLRASPMPPSARRPRVHGGRRQAFRDGNERSGGPCAPSSFASRSILSTGAAPQRRCKRTPPKRAAPHGECGEAHADAPCKRCNRGDRHTTAATVLRWATTAPQRQRRRRLRPFFASHEWVAMPPRANRSGDAARGRSAILWQGTPRVFPTVGRIPNSHAFSGTLPRGQLGGNAPQLATVRRGRRAKGLAREEHGGGRSA